MCLSNASISVVQTDREDIISPVNAASQMCFLDAHLEREDHDAREFFGC
jgi:hypothetical protein